MFRAQCFADQCFGPVATTTGDPHLKGQDGTKYVSFGALSIHMHPHISSPFSRAAAVRRTRRCDMTVLPGAVSTIYNMLSHKKVSVNAVFEKVTYYQAGPRRQKVNGAYVRLLAITIRTNTSSIVNVEYNANHSLRATVIVDGKVDVVGGTKTMVVVDDVEVSLHGRKFTVSTPEWTINADSKVKNTIVDAPTCALGKCFLELGIKAAFDADHGTVAPHGLIGQTW